MVLQVISRRLMHEVLLTVNAALGLILRVILLVATQFAHLPSLEYRIGFSVKDSGSLDNGSGDKQMKVS